MVTMNSEKSACRRKPVEKSSSSSGSGKKTSESVEEADKKNEDVRHRTNESPDLSPNTPTYNVTASCAEDTPNYLVYKKVTACRMYYKYIVDGMRKISKKANSKDLILKDDKKNFIE